VNIVRRDSELAGELKCGQAPAVRHCACTGELDSLQTLCLSSNKQHLSSQQQQQNHDEWVRRARDSWHLAAVVVLLRALAHRSTDSLTHSLPWRAHPPETYCSSSRIGRSQSQSQSLLGRDSRRLASGVSP